MKDTLCIGGGHSHHQFGVNLVGFHAIIFYSGLLLPFVAVATIIQPNGASSSLEYDVNTMVVLNCSARGLPAPAFTWILSGGMYQVSSNTNMDAEGYAVVTSSLTITNVMRGDISFTCSANNSYVMDSHSFTLTIYCK